MTLDYFDTNDVSHLVEELFLLRFDEDDTPFKSTILPICHIAITFIYNDSQSIIFNGHKTTISGLVITGQFYQSYEFIVKKSGFSCGFCFHPTTLYNFTGLNASKLKNKHLPLIEFSQELHDVFNPIFLNHKNDIPKLTKSLKQTLLSLPIKDDPIVDQIDNALNLIHNQDGLLNTYELLDAVNFSQKTLETNFKKIVGLTPGKYIRLYRFLKLMRKYESKEIKLRDLMYMYNYYDHSHFAKDFKHFMKQSPKDYFKNEHPFLNRYLNK